MDEQGIRLIRESFAQVAALAAPASILFHGRLFRLDPSTREIFARPEMRALSGHFVAALGEAVGMLDQPEDLRAAARALGPRLAAGGLLPEHRGPIGEALLWMLEECLAEDFSPAIRAAWRRAYEVMADEALDFADPLLAA